MPGDFDVKVQGADTLARTLDAAAADLDDLTDANRAAGEMVRNEAAGRAPRKTGALAASLRVEAGPQRALITAGVRYAGFQEYGTRYVSPKYYLQGALADADVEEPYYQAADAALGKVRGV